MFICLSDLLIKNDPISNARAEAMFLEVVEGMNKMMVGDVLMQNTV